MDSCPRSNYTKNGTGRTVPLLVSAAMEVNTWEGICPIHQTEERLNVAAEGFTAACTAQEAQRYYEDFLGQLEELEKMRRKLENQQ